MRVLLFFFTLFLILLFYKLIFVKNIKNKSFFKLKKRLISKESKIEKIFSRDDEKKSSDPNININIGLYDNEININRKSNIHRARLSKFKKSKLNGEVIYMDQDQKIYKYVNGQKKYI